MRFTTTRVAAVLAAAFSIVATTSVNAARPEGVPAEQEITPSSLPPGVMNQPITVIVHLNGPSVAEQQGAAGRKLGRGEKDGIKGQLRSQQDAMRPSIQALGGTVLASYQSAINGIKVRIARGQVASLASLPGVAAVRPVQLHHPDNLHGVPLVGGPAVWQSLGIHGEGVKVAIIDTGIDYTHANFGGSGNPADYATAHAAETAPANPAWFGPNAPRVKGGIDLVGDAYNAGAKLADGSPDLARRTPHPDANPLDCAGHGSHVAGTAVGSGVLSNGHMYTGPYNASTLSANSWNVGPGVAPKADIYSVRVFGCEGSTDIVVDAIDWAVDNDMDVINMSLGSDLGTADTPDAVASTNAAKAGVIVVASAGNAGGNAYVVGSPSTAEGAISVAANDPTQTFPGALIGVGAGIQAINANGVSTLPAGSLPIKVLRTATGGISLGCDPAEYVAAGVAGKIAVVMRGTCARVARAIYGQKAGAVAVVMVNNANSFPPFEGQITSNPDTGEAYTVTIPFLGVKSTSGAALSAADGTSTTLLAINIVNPGFKAIASFSSSGPRSGDGNLKPDVTAPGVSISSTAVGTGTGSEILSGTSMAAPHTSGVAALTRQAHPEWRTEDVKSAIMHTADPAGVAGYRTRAAGAGFVQAPGSTATQVVARTSGGKFGGALNFGVAEFRNPYSRSLEITLRNLGGATASFNVAQTSPQGGPHSIGLSSSAVSVPAGGEATVSVTLNVAPATAGAADTGPLSYQDVAGLIQFTPQSPSDNAGVALRVPYLLVVRPQADVSTSVGRFSGGTATATITNKNGGISGDADFYAWGLSAPKSNDKTNQTADIRAVGVQAFPTSASQAFLVFAVNTYDRWSSPSVNEFDIYVDVNGDGTPDYVVIGIDDGLITAGTFNGQFRGFVLDLRTNKLTSNNFLSTAPTDGSTAEILVLASQLCQTGSPCLSSSNPRIAYQAAGFDLFNGGSKGVPGVGKFNVWSNAVSTGDFVSVAPGKTGTSTVTVNSAEAAQTPALGLMVVTLDNKSGGDEAQLIPLGGK